mgnify:CR=1 FL=1
MQPKANYAVIFTSIRTEEDNGYSKMALEMEDLVKNQPGYLGMESAREEIGITISYWESLEAISEWKKNTDHMFAQEKGIRELYSKYHVRICRVEREYTFSK